MFRDLIKLFFALFVLIACFPPPSLLDSERRCIYPKILLRITEEVIKEDTMAVIKAAEAMIVMVIRAQGCACEKVLSEHS